MYQNNFLGGYAYPSATAGNYLPKEQQPTTPVYPSQANQFNGFKGRPVNSIEEVKATIIDLDGSLYIFTDIGNKKIYTKQINLDGTATLNTYSLLEENKEIKEEIPQPQIAKQIEYVSKEEFNQALSQIKEYLGSFEKRRKSTTLNNF